MNEAQKFQAMRLWLNKPIAQILAALDGEGAGTTPDGTPFIADVPLLAGLSMVATWVTQLEPSDGWETFCQRLQRAVASMTQVPDAGSQSAFGLWDGLQAAAAEAGRISGSIQLKPGGKPRGTALDG